MFCLEARAGQRLVSQVPSSPLEPVGDWVWGRLINGFVYRARSSYGGGGGGKISFLLVISTTDRGRAGGWRLFTSPGQAWL